MGVLRRLGIEPFVVAILCAVVVASFLPATGSAAQVLDKVVVAGIAVLFFLYGARLDPRETLEAVKHWRLHTAVFAFTFVVFPILGVILRYALAPVLGTDLAMGILYLTLVPSTVQSSITFVSIARGSVAAAVVSASLSNLAGVVITPLLALALMSAGGGMHIGTDSIVQIALELLLPFALGQLLRRWVVPVMSRIPRISLFDRTTIVLVVYSAFSEGVAEGVWHQVTLLEIVAVVAVCLVLLVSVLCMTAQVADRFHFSTRDKRVIQFCGSKKSLATGLPMASVMFAGHPIGLIVLPLMVYHQIQLMVGSALSSRYGRQVADEDAADAERFADL